MGKQSQADAKQYDSWSTKDNGVNNGGWKANNEGEEWARGSWRIQQAQKVMGFVGVGLGKRDSVMGLGADQNKVLKS